MKEPRQPNRSTALGLWASEMMDWVRSAVVQSSPTVHATRTTKGTFLEAAGGGSGKSNTLQFKGQWVDGTYATGDIVICETISPLGGEMDDGREAGTYIANQGVSAGDLHPGLVPATAEGSVTVAAGAVTAIAVTDPGAGYSSAPVVTIAGDGTGATAHAVISGGVITSFVVDTGGSGYTAATVTVAAPTQTQKWDDFALGHEPKHTYKPQTAPRRKQRITIDAGRDTSVKPRMELRLNLSDSGGVDGSVTIDLADLIAIAPGNKVVKLREWEVCVDGVVKHVVILSSAAY